MIPHISPINEPTITSSASDILLVGMQVRIPIEPGRTDGQFRDFYLGSIESVDDLADTVMVRLNHRQLDGDINPELVERPRFLVDRCRVLPGSKVALVDRDAGGEILAACDTDWVSGQYCDYYVQVAGQTSCMPESNLITASHRADPDPRLQLASYEFHNPSFRQPRDALIESHAELRTAAFGIEDLVGSRIMLLAHQAEVVATVLRDAECRYVLADEVGLGKTIEAAVILKGLRRRHPHLRTLIIAPASLVGQWYFELDHKFWLRFAFGEQSRRDDFSPGLILSHEQIIDNPEMAKWVAAATWDLLIVDEAHQVPKNADLNTYISELSGNTERVLLLSATPVQRRSTEFLSLLKLLYPKRYGQLSPERFSEMLAAQYDLLRIIARVGPDLNLDYFDPDDFCEEMEGVLRILQHDSRLAEHVTKVQAHSADIENALEAAQRAVAYIGENYRLERRVIRNRRANLQIELPTRVVNEEYSYRPSATEAAALDELHEYADALLGQHGHDAMAQTVARLLFHAAFSGPKALLALLEYRESALRAGPSSITDVALQRLLASASPRESSNCVQRLLAVMSEISDERTLMGRLLWQVQGWHDKTQQMLEELPWRQSTPCGPHRFLQVLHAVDEHLRAHPDAKIIIFADWLTSLQTIQPFLRKHLGEGAVFEFHVGMRESDLQNQVVEFQESQSRAVLLCDELGGEGRNFQMADLIIHLDLPWTPTSLEQRIGRVDRLGRTGEVISVVPFAQDQIEQDLYHVWQHAFELFTRSMSGMEIVLEGIQDELMDSLREDTRNGILRVLPQMMKRAQTVREQVEEERYYEEGAINSRRREEFARISARYDDGSILRNPLLDWADQSGLKNRYQQETDTAIYFPSRFNLASMHNAKFRKVPNMEDALTRSRRASSLRIEGTFNRSVAVVREDLVFYAPSSDPWTDTIIRNAQEADRGRSCTILRKNPDVTKTSLLFDFAYRIQVDSRPLFALGHDPIHLLRAHGYLYTPIHRVLLTHHGEVIPPGHKLAKLIQAPYSNSRDVHLGKRSGQHPPLAWFKKQFDPEDWHSILERVFATADEAISEEFSFVDDLAEEAREDFGETARGLRAAADWYITQNLIPNEKNHLASIDTYEEISSALVTGLRKPLFTLESACFWILQPTER